MKLLLALPALLVFASNAWAGSSCTSPSAPNGAIEWNLPNGQYCAAGTWTNLSVSTTAFTCSTAGKVMYNNSEIEYCNGTNWVSTNGLTLRGPCTLGAGGFNYDATSSSYLWCDGANYHVMGGSSPSVSSTWLASAMDNSNNTTYTEAATFGAGSINRYVVVGVAARASSAYTISSVTVAGVTATQIGQYSYSDSLVGFYAAYMPTITSGNIVVNFSGIMNRMAYSAWSVSNLQSLTPVASVNMNSTNYTGPAALNVSAGGVVLSVEYDDNGTSTSWNNQTNDADTTASDTGLNWHFSGASAPFASAQTSLNVTGTVAGSWAHLAMLYVSLR